MKPLIGYSFFVFGCFCIGSCKKDKDPQPGGTTLHKIVVRGLTPTGDVSRTYNYDQQNKLISATIDNIVLQDSEFSYDAQGRLVTFTAPDLFGHVYTYDNNGRINKKIMTPISPNEHLARYYYTYAYDAQGRMIADTQYQKTSNLMLSYNTYIYDNAGNVIEKNYFIDKGTGLFTVSEKFRYTYDDKPNPYYNIGAVIFFSVGTLEAICKNNLLTTTSSLGIDDAKNYTYFSNGQVQQQDLKSPRIQTKITTFFYYKAP